MNGSTTARTLRAALFALPLLLLSACKPGYELGDGNGSNQIDFYGPGSSWKLSLDSNAKTFELSKHSSPTAGATYTLSGSYSLLNSGFTQLTVDAKTGSGGPSVGSEITALRADDYALFIQPFEAGANQLLVLVEDSGSCPAGDINANWISYAIAGDGAANDDASAFFGRLRFEFATNDLVYRDNYSLENPGTRLDTTTVLDGISCSRGIVDDEGVQYLSGNSSLLANDSERQQLVLALASEAIAAVTMFDGNYAGLMFDASELDGMQVLNVSGDCSSGTCTLGTVNNVSTGGVDASNLSLTLTGSVDSPENGFVSGSLKLTEGDTISSGAVVCLVNLDVLDSGDNLISCVGQAPSDPQALLNLFLVTR